MTYDDAINVFKKYGVNNTSFLSDKNLKIEYHRLARQHHTDVGGEETAISDINVAYKTILRERQKVEKAMSDRVKGDEGKEDELEVTAWIFDGHQFTGYYKYMQSHDYIPCFNKNTEYVLAQEKKNKEKVEAIVETLNNNKVFNVVFIAGIAQCFKFFGATKNPENDQRFLKCLKQEIKDVKSKNGFSLLKLFSR